MQRFNHMGLSVPEGTITPDWFADVREFYGDVFGWRASSLRRGYTSDGPLLGVHLRLDDWGDQYVVVVESASPLQASAMEHLGLLVDTAEEHSALFDACSRAQARDARVKVVGDTSETTLEGVVQDDWHRPTRTYRSFTVSFLLPIAFEIGSVRDAVGHEAPRAWTYA